MLIFCFPLLKAWLSFMVAFMSWYSIPPLMSVISKELGISSDEVYDSNVTAVAATISK